MNGNNNNNMERISKMEEDLIKNLTNIHETMTNLTFEGIMGEEALRQLSIEQKSHYDNIKKVFILIEYLMKSKYVKQRVTKTEVSTRKKKMTEMEKQQRAKNNPQSVFVCERCNRIFTKKSAMNKHQRDTVICRVIKNTKQGLLQNLDITTRSWGRGGDKENITAYIADHLNGNDTEEEEEEAERERLAAEGEA